MTIFSVNESLERDLLSDRGFVCSHLTPYLSLLTSNQVSGQTLEPYLIGRLLDTYESIGQGRPMNLVSEAVKSLDLLAANPALLAERDCLQLVLSTDVVTRPIVGLSSIILLSRIAQHEARTTDKGNVFESCEDNVDLDFIFEIPTHISYVPYDFCSDMTDVDSKDNFGAHSDNVALYVPYQACLTSTVNTTFCVKVTQQDWAYKLANNYTQGQYDLRLACATATRRPYGFALMAAVMLGVSFDNLVSYDADTYNNLTADQKYQYIKTIKPLIEHIAYDLISGNLISL